MAFDWWKLIGNAAPILGGAAKSAQDANAQRDRNAILKEQVQLNRDRYALEAPGARMSTSARASILSNFKPTSVEWGGPGSGARGELPKISGGIVDSLANLDPQTKALVAQVLKDELAGQMRGGETGGNQDRTLTLPDNFGKSSTGDKILGGASLATSILGAAKDAGLKLPGTASPTSYVANDVNSVANASTAAANGPGAAPSGSTAANQPWWKRIFGSGGGSGSDNPYAGNPFAAVFDPVLAPTMTGGGDEQMVGADVRPRVKAF